VANTDGGISYRTHVNYRGGTLRRRDRNFHGLKIALRQLLGYRYDAARRARHSVRKHLAALNARLENLYHLGTVVAV
jgi:hypothetical protein